MSEEEKRLEERKRQRKRDIAWGWGVAIIIVIVAGVALHFYILPQQEQADLTNINRGIMTGYEIGFENAFREMVNCFEAREGIRERDAEWASEWEAKCEEDKRGIIEAIVMGEPIPFSNAFCMKFVNLEGENVTFLDGEKEPIPCGRDVLTGKCLDAVCDTPHRWIVLES